MKRNLLVLMFFYYAGFCNAQDGKLDITFGNNGFALADLGTATSFNSVVKQVVVQSDTAIYFIREVGNLISITKKRSNGSTDLAYGTNGISTSIAMEVFQAAIQSDGKIILVGRKFRSNTPGLEDQLVVARFNTIGSLDATFGNDGIIPTKFGQNDVATSVTISNDGSIIVGGYTYYDDILKKTALVCRFGNDGRSVQVIALGNQNNDPGFINGFDAVAVQNDGKIIAAGYRVIGNNSTYTLTRFKANGGIDNTFPPYNYPLFDIGFKMGSKNFITLKNDSSILVAGTYNNDFRIAHFSKDGIFDKMQTTDFNGQNDTVTGLALKKNEDIVLAGYSKTDTTAYFAIAQYTSNLMPDNSFSVDGKLITDFDAHKSFVNGVAIQKNGKIVAAGYLITSNNRYVIAGTRYNIDGTEDGAFAANGKLVDTVKFGSTKFTNIAVQKDGKIITGGNTLLNTNNAFVLARYTINGRLDETFATGGKNIEDFGFSNNKLNSIAIQTDGKILAGGSIDNSFAIARYNADGSLDKTFGTNGIQKNSFGLSSIINSICIQADGKIIAGGSVLARYNTDGSLDGTFNGVGYVTINCTSIAIQNSGKIVVLNDNNDAVSKYLPNGQLDISFGNNGTVVIVSDRYETVRSVLIQPDNKILVGGYSQNTSGTANSYLSLIRYNNDGTADNTFNNGKILHTRITQLSYGNALQIQKDNKIILAGYNFNGNKDEFMIVRYNTDGTLDRTFNNVGVVFTDVSANNSRIEGIVVADYNLYVAGFGEYPGTFGVVAKYHLCAKDVLPMKFVNFKAKSQNKSVVLSWQIENELDLKGFSIERGKDSINFTKIGYIYSKGINQPIVNYEAEDDQPFNGLNYYRIKMELTNSPYINSKVLSVNICEDAILLNISPNPVKNRMTLNTNIKNENTTLQFINNNGIKLKEIKTILNGPLYIDINTLPFGMYNLQIITKSGFKTIKFVKY